MIEEPTDDELRRKHECERLRALFELPISEWGSDDIVAVLTSRYEPSVIPPCRVCGEVLGCHAMGGGQPTVWACDGREADPEREGRKRWKAGRSESDEHYRQSRYRDLRQGGDEVVMELIRRMHMLRVQL